MRIKVQIILEQFQKLFKVAEYMQDFNGQWWSEEKILLNLIAREKIDINN